MAAANPPPARAPLEETTASSDHAHIPLSSLPRFIEISTSDADRSEGSESDSEIDEAQGPLQRLDYSGQLAHLAILASLYYASLILTVPATTAELFLPLVLIGLVLVVVSLAVMPRLDPVQRRAAVLILDVAWLLTALWLGQGLHQLILPLLFVVVAITAWRGARWELAAVLLLVMGGVVGVALIGLSGMSVATAAVVAVLMAATGGAVRLLTRATRNAGPGVVTAGADAHHALLQASPDAVFTIDTKTFRIQAANPAALAYFDDDSGDGLMGRILDQVLALRDEQVLPACRAHLIQGEAVPAATAVAAGPEGQDRELVLNFTPISTSGGRSLSQVIIRVPETTNGGPMEASTWPDYDFTSHYIPSLTHELNNHLGAIRLSAELSCNTGIAPDCMMIQREVDHCQQVLQTVVTQMLRASRPQSGDNPAPQCDLGQAIENCLLLAQPQILSEGIQLRLSLPSTGLPVVAGNMHEVQEALVRIILRSARALREKDHPRVLKCNATAHANEVTVAFSHGGAGLSWTELAAINGQSSVVPRGEYRVWAAVREGLTSHGGTLSASNSVARGVQFRITLKVADAQVEGGTYEQAN